MGLILPGRFTRQPQQAAAVNPQLAEFLPQRLVNFALGPYDAITGTYLTTVGTGVVSRIGGSLGVGLQFGDAAGATYLSAAIRAERDTSMTMIWVGQSPSGSVVRDFSASLGTIPIWNNAGTFDARIGGADFTAAGSWATAQDQVVVVTASATAVKVFANGVLVINGGAPGGSSPSISPWVIHRNGNNAQGTNSTSRLFSVFALPFPDALAIAVSGNPSLLYQSSSRKFWLAQASASIAIASDATTATAASSTLSTQVAVSAASSTPASASSALSTQVAISAASSTPVSASSALTVGSVWSASATTATAASSALSTQVAISASASANTAASSTLSTQVAISAASNTPVSASSALTVSSVWAASAISQARASAALTTAIALSAVAHASTSASSSLSVLVQIAASALTTTSATVSLTTVVPPPFGPISITRTMIMTVLRSFIAELASPLRVLSTPVNRAAMPKYAYVAMTPGKTFPLATPTVTVDASGQRHVKRSSQFNCQIDCYGPDSGDLAELITMLFREQYAVEKFAASGLEIAPLYASDAKQLPIVTGEEQYLERWSFEVSMQFNPIVSTVQQSANMLDVGIISVDEAYSP